MNQLIAFPTVLRFVQCCKGARREKEPPISADRSGGTTSGGTERLCTYKCNNNARVSQSSKLSQFYLILLF